MNEQGVNEAEVTEAEVTEAGVTEAGVTEAGVNEAGVTEAGVNEGSPPPNPVPVAADTTDLRTGPEINLALLALLPLVGVWQGTGHGVTPDGQEFNFFLRARFAHDGRPFLSYDSQTWIVTDDGAIVRPAARESGFWRPGEGADDVEVSLALAFGVVEILAGHAGDARWELETRHLARTPTATDVLGEKRFYAIVPSKGTENLGQESLVYIQELAVNPGDYCPHLNARLARV